MKACGKLDCQARSSTVKGPLNPWKAADLRKFLIELISSRSGQCDTSKAPTVNASAAIALRFHEIRQDMIVTPSRVAQLGPVVEIQSIAANVKHEIQDARAAQSLSTRPIGALQFI